MTLDELAMAAYTAYGDYMEWEDADMQMSAWRDLDAQQQGAWKAAASRVADLYRRED
jgi:hypothetical protein